MPVESWLVGDWSGRVSRSGNVYSKPWEEVIDAELKVSDTGSVHFSLVWGMAQRGPIQQRNGSCEASGVAVQAERKLKMTITKSDCQDAPPGSEAEVKMTRVGSCLVQWDTKEGRLPTRREQFVWRRRKCR